MPSKVDIDFQKYHHRVKGTQDPPGQNFDFENFAPGVPSGVWLAKLFQVALTYHDRLDERNAFQSSFIIFKAPAKYSAICSSNCTIAYDRWRCILPGALKTEKMMTEMHSS